MRTIFLAAAAIGAFTSVPAVAQPAAPTAPLAPRGVGPVTRADFQQRLRAHFAKLDANHDGFVDRAEADSRTGRLHPGAPGGAPDGTRPPRARMDPNAMFDAMDANRDGTVTRSEFLAFHAAGRHPVMVRGGEMNGPAAGPDGAARPMRARHAGMHMGFGGRWFDRLDADHDGRVSLAEADRAAAAMFDRLDANRDGTITPDERGAARQRFRQRIDAPREQ